MGGVVREASCDEEQQKFGRGIGPKKRIPRQWTVEGPDLNTSSLGVIGWLSTLAPGPALPIGVR